ncbi:hypothetical protein [Chryseobacterium sp. M5A1_1a]
MKTITLLSVVFMVFSTAAVFSQVGIKTGTPKSTLHIAGDLTLNSSLRVGGNENTAGDSGNAGAVLKSQGAGLPPVWAGIETVLMPQNFLLTQTANVFLPLGINMPWLNVPNLSQSITVPAGKKALVFVSGQICVQQTKNVNILYGISVGLFENSVTFPLISFTGQLAHATGLGQEFVNLPFSYSEFLISNGSDLTKVYNVKARVNYVNGNDTSDIQVVNNPFSRGDYSQLRISMLIF